MVKVPTSRAAPSIAGALQRVEDSRDERNVGKWYTDDTSPHGRLVFTVLVVDF